MPAKSNAGYASDPSVIPVNIDRRTPLARPKDELTESLHAQGDLTTIAIVLRFVDQMCDIRTASCSATTRLNDSRSAESPPRSAQLQSAPGSPPLTAAPPQNLSAATTWSIRIHRRR